MIDHNDKLLDKFEIGKVLLHRCVRELMKRNARDLGVTIIVHAARIGPRDMHKAVCSAIGKSCASSWPTAWPRR